MYKTLNQMFKLVLLWAQLTKIYLSLPTSVQPISITKTLLIVPTKTDRDLPLFNGKLLIKFQNILRNTIQVIIRHRIRLQTDMVKPVYPLQLRCRGYNHRLFREKSKDRQCNGQMIKDRQCNGEMKKKSKHSEKHYSSYHTT
jgi:hypothetical protein